MKKGLFSKLIRKRWEIGFVEGGYDAVFSDKKLQIHWVSNPPKDRWYADPFILDVTDDKIVVLADGEIRAVGTKDEIMPELMAASGVCSRLVNKI